MPAPSANRHSLGCAKEILDGGVPDAGGLIVGDVTMGEDVGGWFNSTLRGDVDAIVFGNCTNIHEECILNADLGSQMVIGSGVTVGHGAVVHGARIGDSCIVGICAVLLNGSEVGRTRSSARSRC